MLEDYFEEEAEQQQPASAEVAINNGRRNQPSRLCVLAAKERAQYARCDMGLCMVPCFVEHCTKVNL
jgi:hypothetical protein